MTDASRPRGRARWVILALAALAVAAVAFAIGRFSTFGSAIQDATDAGLLRPTTTPADAGFARDMQVHHTQAIEMAMEIYRKTEDDELRMLSYDIATAQAGQRGEMFGWLVEWGLPQRGSEPLMTWMEQSAAAHDQHAVAATEEELLAEMGMATSEELAALSAATGSEADCLFLDLMITHHLGAIPMAEAVVELGQVPRVRTVAEGMIASQTSEIDAMRSIQNRLGCSG